METTSKKTESASHVRVIEEISAYWRVLFDNPPFNIVDATIFEGLQDLLARMDASPILRVEVLCIFLDTCILSDHRSGYDAYCWKVIGYVWKENVTHKYGKSG